jgi:hypothetical protein
MGLLVDKALEFLGISESQSGLEVGRCSESLRIDPLFPWRGRSRGTLECYDVGTRRSNSSSIAPFAA